MNKYFILLLIISILAAGLQGYYTITTSTYSDDTSYLHLRQAEHVQQTQEIIREDPLSSEGRTFYGSSLYWYILGTLLTIFGTYALKLLPALFILSLPLLVYLFTNNALNDPKYAFLAGITTLSIPILWQELTNTLNILLLFIPLSIIFLIYYLKITPQQQSLLPFIIVSFLLGALTPYSLILAFTLIVWRILTAIEGYKTEHIRSEATFFFALFAFFFQFYIYRELIITQGPAIIYQNTPQALLTNYFANINLFTLIVGVGVISLIAGAYGIYNTLKKPNETFTLTTAFIIGIVLLLIFKFIPLTQGLILLSIGFAIMSATGYQSFFKYLNLTKLAKFTKPLFALSIALIILTLTIPAIVFGYQTSTTLHDTELSNILREQTTPRDLVLTSLNEGHFITHNSERSVFLTNEFIGIAEVNEKYTALRTLFTTESRVKAEQLLNQYDIDYIILSPTAQETYNIDILPYSVTNPCIQLIHETAQGGKLYEYTC